MEKKRKINKSIINICLLLSLLLFIFYLFSDIIYAPLTKRKGTERRLDDIRYILQWTKSDTLPFRYMGKGRETFLKSHCPMNNCFITHNRNIKKIADYDAILFHGPEINREKLPLPDKRSTDQLYVFVSMESAHYYPINDKIYDNFFNWTWTYKLNSDLYYGYIIIKDKNNKVIGPRQEMQWLNVEEMEPIDDALKDELSEKYLTAAWIVSNCNTPGKREEYVKEMQKELKKHNMTVDIYGKCGRDECANESDKCASKVKKFYYFYLSFENSFSEDYVTEKLLTGLLNNAVPVVYGGANYSRFLPNSAYLNARKLGVQELVRKMVEAIQNKEKYYAFFKWRNHYSYHYVEESPETNYYCQLCSKINEIKNTSINEENSTTVKMYQNFRNWWNNPRS